MVVEREIVAGNVASAGILLDLPVRSTKGLSSLNEVLNFGFTTPVSLGGLLELTVAYKNCQNGSIDEVDEEYIPPIRGNPRTELINAKYCQP